MTSNKKRVGLCIDGDNFYHTQKKHLYYDIDAEKLLRFCENYGELVSASYYLSKYDDPDSFSEEERDKFSRALMNLGYRVTRVPTKRINTPTGEKRKSKVDAHILLDVPEQKDYWDVLVLCSGDSDLDVLIKRLQTNGKRVIVLSTATAVAEDIRMLVGLDYIDLLDLKDQLDKNPTGDTGITKE
jgi:uncharacterized LabA/DUF88 family protein